MTKKKSSKDENIELGKEKDIEKIEPPDIATFALMMAIQARVLSLVKPLFPLLEKIEAGEKVTEKVILDRLSSIKFGEKTALEKLKYFRNQQ